MADPSTGSAATEQALGTATVVAIDGPAGSGKSSVSKETARRLGFGYLDTGAVYRALAWHVLAHGADTSDSAAVLDAAGDFEWSISLDPDDFWIRADGATANHRGDPRSARVRGGQRRRARAGGPSRRQHRVPRLRGRHRPARDRDRGP